MAAGEEKFSSNEAFLAEMERRRAAHNAAQAPQSPTGQSQSQPPVADERSQRIAMLKESREPQPGGLIGLLYKLGVAKNKQQANRVLLIVMVVVLAITAWVLLG